MTSLPREEMKVAIADVTLSSFLTPASRPRLRRYAVGFMVKVNFDTNVAAAPEPAPSWRADGFLRLSSAQESLLG